MTTKNDSILGYLITVAASKALDPLSEISDGIFKTALMSGKELTDVEFESIADMFMDFTISLHRIMPDVFKLPDKAFRDKMINLFNEQYKELNNDLKMINTELLFDKKLGAGH